MNAGKIPAIVALLLSFFVLPDCVQAKYSGGSGTYGDPYKIGLAADLNALGGNTGDYDKYFVLTEDINLAPYSFTTAVIAPDTNNSNSDFNGTPFSGVFDGNNHTISNLTIDTNGAGNYYLGLFGEIGLNSQIKNLGLKDVNIIGGDNSLFLGGLAGNIQNGIISNCHSTGTVSGGGDSGILGGLVGENGGTISNCYSTATVSGGGNSSILGGLVGSNWGKLSFCYSTGTVKGGSENGGLVGKNTGTINNCYSISSVSGGNNSTDIGGLAGYSSSGNINNCYSTGSVTGGNNSENLGGLVGYQYLGIVGDCYSTGDVNSGSGSSHLGGLEGGHNAGTLGSCYFLTTSGPNNGLGTPLTDTQMKQQSSFSGWVFPYVWRIREGVGYPKVRVSSYSGGSGTADAPYKIGTAGDLLALAANTADYDAYFILTADIDLAAAGTFTTAVIAPDTNSSNNSFDGNAFTGIFDGNGYTISNLTIDTGGAGNDYLGLFGQIGNGGQIKNLGLKDVNITGGDNSLFLGGLAGWSASGSNISNCHSTGTVSSGASSNHLGGLAGDNDGTISNCFSTAAVNGGHNSVDLGGLVGFGAGTISNCYATGDVNGGDSSQYLGGLLGRGWPGTSISKCYSTSTIKGGNSSQNLGGLIGFDNQGGISNCYSSGVVSSGNDSNTLGGLMGYNFEGTISNCYSTSDVNSGSGSSHLGGLEGGHNAGTLGSCYFLTTSGPNNGFGTPLTNTQMKHQSNFSGWDFVNAWRIREGVGYPKLYISDYSGGSGTAGEPYEIATVADLLAMAANTADYDAYFILTADINLASYSFTTTVIAPDTNDTDWNFEGVAFTGSFNGNGHSISNLTIDTNGAENDYLGLFGEIGSGGQIKNLGLKYVNIVSGGNSYYLGGLVGSNSGTISNCYSISSVSGGNNSTYIGGLVGYNDGDVNNCYSTGDVSGGDELVYLGGLMGYNDGDVHNCYSTCTVSGTDNSESLGGLVGYNRGGTISKCYSTGTVSGTDNSESLGGLVGVGENGSNISNCYSTGAVIGGNNSQYLGGLVGVGENGSNISNCYSTGTVSGGGIGVGGLVGGYWGSITSCYFLTGSGPDNGYGTPLTDGQMKKESSFSGWDFDTIWTIYENVSYPKLVWQFTCTLPSAPAGVSATDGNTDHIQVSWNSVSGAATYEVWRSTTNNSGAAIKLGEHTSPFDDNSVTDGTTYYYWVKAENSCGTSGFSSSDSGYAVKSTTVPNVADKTAADANAAIVDANLVVGSITATFSNTVAAGKVISQDPNAGTKVAVGSAVNYKKSLGKPVVPNIVGKTAADANTAITSVDLVVGTITTAYSDTVDANKVISQNPAAGTAVVIGSAVNYVKSLGKSVIVPYIVGKTAADANAAIVDANLVVGTITTAYSNTVAAGKVISQNPAAGTKVAIGSAVSYVTSLGKPVVPNIVGKKAADANTAITSVDNLKVGIITTAYDNNDAGTVISQNPVVGTAVTIGSSVNYKKSLGKPTVPYIVGKTAAAANAAITSVDNLKVGTVTTAYSDTVAAGVVISQDPNAGTAVLIGSSVNYVKSLGKPVVPNIVGKTAADANTAIVDANLVVGDVNTAYSNAVAAGKVISQNPAAGKAVSIGSSVSYVKSLGKPVVPNIVGKTAADANTAITSVGNNANLKVGTITTAYSDTVDANKVISQSPVANTAVNIGSAVNYVKSLGKPAVPSIVGKTVAAANTAITSVDNLKVGTVTNAYSDTMAAGVVISQDPNSGTVVNTGSKVNYVKSLGKPAVPNIVGMTDVNANNAVTSVDNLQVGTVTTAYSNTVAAGKVISQNPAAGTRVNIGSSVNYVKSLGKPHVPDIVGQTAADANTAITSVDNLKVGTITTTYSDTVDANKVISQSPVANTAVNIGSAVNYVKSLGKKP